jgi:hypothetical protein
MANAAVVRAKALPALGKPALINNVLSLASSRSF